MTVKVARAAAAGVLLLVLSGCSSQERRDYSLPDPLCHVRGLSESVVKPLLPTGKDLYVDVRELSSDPDTNHLCVVQVDKKDGLRINTLRNEGNIDALHYAREGSGPLRNAEALSIPGVASAALGDDGALLSMNCPSPKVDYLVATVRVGDRNKPPENPAEQRRNIETFLRSYIPGLIQAKCTR